MKQDIHPQYFPKAKVICSCGKTYEIGSTKEKMEVEICSNCHPFFTGQEKLIDTAGRVEKFKARQAKAAGATKAIPKVGKAKPKTKKK
ncbi:MAG: 50S ribosomal protein L31 [Candidatus Colwellbacteria bacterium]|nr:50S ribosomal protein L31 [Candidatus Colwellbacteria bacterium]